VQRARESANRTQCRNNLKQLGLALLNYESVNHSFPPGMVADSTGMTSAQATGFTFLLPYLEQDTTWRLYNFKAPWYDRRNYRAVGIEVKLFYCPSNRDGGSISLSAISAQWGDALPPTAAGCDYALSKGANAAINQDWTRVPVEVRGVFGFRGSTEKGIRLAEIKDGTSLTFAIGEAAAGTDSFLDRDLTNPTQPLI